MTAVIPLRFSFALRSSYMTYGFLLLAPPGAGWLQLSRIISSEFPVVPRSDRRFNLLPPLPIQNRARSGAGVPSAFEYDLAVDDDVLDASRVLVRLLERGVVNDGIGIEDGHIRPLPGAQQTSVIDANLRRVGGSHLPHGLFE